MRSAFAILGLMAIPLPGWATPPRRGIVKAEVAELRAGPSDKPEFYVTNRVPRNTALEVVGEAPGGWLKVRPPKGSFSWINARFLQSVPPDPNSRVVALQGQEVPVYYGSEVMQGKPTVESGRLKQGHLVVFLRQPVRDASGVTLARIEPPDSEVRYVRASDLDGATTGSFTPAPKVTPVAARPTGPLPVATTPAANTTQSGDLSYRLAYAADIGRRYAEAARLYSEASIGLARGNPALASAASRRAAQLNDFLRSTGMQTAATASLHVPATAATATPRTAPAAVGIYRGRVRRAGLRNGRWAYFLDVYVARGLRQPGCYLVPGYGVDLPYWLDRDVEVHGIPRGQGANFYLEATLVRSLN